MPWDFIAFSLFSYHCIFTIFFDSWYFTYFLWFSLSICSLEVTVHWNSPLWGASLAFWLPFTYLLFTLEVLAAYYLPYGLYFCIALVSCFLQGSLDYLNVLPWLLLAYYLPYGLYLLTTCLMAFTFDVMDLMYDVLLIMPHFCVCSIPMSHGRVVLCSLRVSPTLDLVLHSPCIFSSPVCVDLVLGAPWVHFSTFACLWLILDVTADMMDVSRCWSILVCGSLFEVVAAMMRLLLYLWLVEGICDDVGVETTECMLETLVPWRSGCFSLLLPGTWWMCPLLSLHYGFYLYLSVDTLPKWLYWSALYFTPLVRAAFCIAILYLGLGGCVPFTYYFVFGVVPHAFDSLRPPVGVAH